MRAPLLMVCCALGLLLWALLFLAASAAWPPAAALADCPAACVEARLGP